MKVHLSEHYVHVVAENPEEWQKLTEFAHHNSLDTKDSIVSFHKDGAEYYCLKCHSNTDGDAAYQHIACNCSMWDRKEGRPIFEHWEKIQWDNPTKT